MYSLIKLILIIIKNNLPYFEIIGSHCILCNDHGYSYYFGFESEEIKYINDLDGFKIKSVA